MTVFSTTDGIMILDLKVQKDTLMLAIMNFTHFFLIIIIDSCF